MSPFLRHAHNKRYDYLALLEQGGGGGGDVTSVEGGTGITVSPETGDVVVSITATGVTPDTYGDATHVPVITINAEGQITVATTAAIPVSGVTWAADLVNSTDTDQYVSGISFDASGAAHGAGGLVNVNGTSTFLNWVDAPATLQNTGTSVLSLGQNVNNDFIAFGAAPANTSLIRIPNGQVNLISNPTGLVMWMPTTTELTFGTNSGLLHVIDMWASGIINMQANFIDLLFQGGSVACQVEFDVSPPAVAWRYTGGVSSTWIVEQAVADEDPGIMQIEGGGAFPGATTFTTGQPITLTSGPASIPGTKGLAGQILLGPGGDNNCTLWTGETSPGEMILAFNIQNGDFADSGNAPTGSGNYVGYIGYSATNPTVNPKNGLFFYANSGDGHLYLREAGGSVFPILPSPSDNPFTAVAAGSTITAANGDCYLVDASGAQVTINFPADATASPGFNCMIKLINTVASPVLLVAGADNAIEDPQNPGHFSANAGTVFVTANGASVAYKYNAATKQFVEWL